MADNLLDRLQAQAEAQAHTQAHTQALEATERPVAEAEPAAEPVPVVESAAVAEDDSLPGLEEALNADLPDLAPEPAAAPDPAPADDVLDAADRLNDLAAKNPALMQVAGDLIMQAQDFPMADKLAERLDALRVPAARLSGHPDRYKIKLRSVGYRLFYEVRDEELIVVVVAVGKRERSAVY